MAFVQQLECDQIEEPSILWKFPLLLLSAFLKQSDHQLLLADDLLGDFANFANRRCHLSNNDDCNKYKWEPSLPTIEEEENANYETDTPLEASCTNNNNNSSSSNNTNTTSMWQTALYNAGTYLPSKQIRVLLGIFVSCCSTFVPIWQGPFWIDTKR